MRHGCHFAKLAFAMGVILAACASVPAGQPDSQSPGIARPVIAFVDSSIGVAVADAGGNIRVLQAPTKALPTAAGDVSRPVWSRDGTRLLWVAGGTLHLVDVITFESWTWPCACRQATFRGRDPITIGPDASSIYVYSPGQPAPARQNLTGDKPPTHEPAVVAAGTELTIVSAVDPDNIMNYGGPSHLFLVDRAGNTRRLPGVSQTTVPVAFGHTDPTTERVALQIGARWGACHSRSWIEVVDLAAASVIKPDLATAGDWSLEDIHWDPHGTLWATARPQIDSCMVDDVQKVENQPGSLWRWDRDRWVDTSTPTQWGHVPGPAGSWVVRRRLSSDPAKDDRYGLVVHTPAGEHAVGDDVWTYGVFWP